jgi:hypothetical protein
VKPTATDPQEPRSDDLGRRGWRQTGPPPRERKEHGGVDWRQDPRRPKDRGGDPRGACQTRHRLREKCVRGAQIVVILRRRYYIEQTENE